MKNLAFMALAPLLGMFVASGGQMPALADGAGSALKLTPAQSRDVVKVWYGGWGGYGWGWPGVVWGLGFAAPYYAYGYNYPYYGYSYGCRGRCGPHR